MNLQEHFLRTVKKFESDPESESRKADLRALNYHLSTCLEYHGVAAVQQFLIENGFILEKMPTSFFEQGYFNKEGERL